MTAAGETPPFRFSPSAQDTFRDCPRKWWFDKVAKIPRDTDPTLVWGTTVHYVLENYLRDGTIVKPATYTDGRDTLVVTNDHLVRAAASHKHLPAPGTWDVELWVPDMQIIPGLEVKAKIDLYKASKVALGDHKSTKTIRTSGEWATTPASLSKNPQGLFYAGALQRAGILPAGRDVAFFHNQIQRVGAVLSRRIDTVFPADRILAAWDASVSTAEAMVAVWKKAPALADQDLVPYNTDACDKYSGCSMAPICTAHRKSASSPTMTSLARALDDRTTTPGYPMSETTPAPRRLVSFGKTLSTPTPAPAPTPPATPAKAPTTNNVTSPNAVPVDPETVQGAFLREVAEAIRTNADMLAAESEMPNTNEDVWALVREECVADMVPVEFWPNVAVACGVTPVDDPRFVVSACAAPWPDPADPNLLAGWPYTAEYLVSGAVHPGSEGATEADVQAAADGLLTLSGPAFAAAVAEAPPVVLAAAGVGASIEQAAVLEAVAAPSAPSEAAEDILARYTTAPQRRAAAVAVYHALLAGGPAATVLTVQAALRTAGVQRVRDTATQEVMDALSHVPTLDVTAGTVTVKGAPKPAPAPAPKPEYQDETRAPSRDDAPPAAAPDAPPAHSVEFRSALAVCVQDLYDALEWTVVDPGDYGLEDWARGLEAVRARPGVAPPANTTDWKEGYARGQADAANGAADEAFWKSHGELTEALGLRNASWMEALAEVARLRGASGTAPFTLVVGNPPRNVPSVYWYDVPCVAEVAASVREGVNALVNKDTKAPEHWATFSDYGRTPEKHMTVALDRALAAGASFPAGGYAWLPRSDAWAAEHLYHVLRDANVVVIGA